MSAHHTIAGLRERLFATIDGVRDGSVDVQQAKVIGELAQVITNTARVEVDYLRATSGDQSPFLAGAHTPADPPPPALPPGITGIRQHRLKG